MVRIGLTALCTALLSCCTAPLVLAWTKKIKAQQPILGYVSNHLSKSGTPTMGGIMLLLSACAVGLASNAGYSRFAFLAACSAFGFGIIGFLDDYIKIKGGNNLGLKAYQKLIAQFGLGIILAVFAYRESSIGSVLNVPFVGITIDIGMWAIPIYVLFIVGAVNFVNLTDGLDGLVSTTGSVYMVAFSIILYISALPMVTPQYENYLGLSAFSLSYGVSLAVFFVLNSFPAKIFMGDTGSLATGAAIICVALFSRNVLYFLIIGVVYAVSGVSVIMQVAFFKLTRKRIFKMAPFHHHLERCGIHENKIVASYSLITLCGGILVISFL